ncbi:hypothetical protein HPB50_008094 [Hyalomma asiaticum]|uniref:Uncharacterized protein n=1 Tax=Hyalomma asiaticum TaxID=266040 RepID=A0ACB7S5I0_HYAAI|nr:hypothetical protein HPB50_008094 [Hyalomma asiaticum]
MREELEALAKEIKQLDALIEPHVCDDEIAEEYGGLRRNQGLITRIRTRFERLQRESTTDADSTTAVSSASNAGSLKLPKLELQKLIGDRAVHKNATLLDTERFLYFRTALTGKAAAGYDKSHTAAKDVLDSSTLNSILNSIRLEVESRERIHAGSTEVSHPVPKQMPPGCIRGKASAARLKVGVEWEKQRCPLCESESHDTAICDAVIPVNEKKLKLRSHGSRYITPLCDPPAPAATEKTTTPLLSTALLSSHTKKSVLPKAQVSLDGNHRKCLARCLFDGGSQRSFVTEYISRQINLEVIGEEEVTICPFGGVANGMKSKRRLTDAAVNVEDLTGLATRRSALPPARNDRKDIDILMVADSYCSVVTGEERNVKGSLLAVNTDFGWSLQSPILLTALVVCCSSVTVLRTSVVDPGLSLSNELRAFWELESLRISTRDVQMADEGEHRIPVNVRMILASAADKRLSQLAELADSVLAVAPPSVAALQPDIAGRAPTTALHDIREHISRLADTVAAMQARSSPEERQRSGGTSRPARIARSARFEGIRFGEQSSMNVTR